MATWQPYLFFYPHDKKVLAYISKIVQERVLVTIIHVQEVIYEVSFGGISFDSELPGEVKSGSCIFQRAVT